MKKLLSISSLLLTCVSVLAQTETAVISPTRNDSLPLTNDSLAVRIALHTFDLINQITFINEPLFADSVSSPILFQPSGYHANFVIMPLNASSPLRWGNFQVAGTFQQNRYPGLMDMESGSLGLQYNHGRFSAYAGGVVNKYAFYQGVYTQKGVTANVSYIFSPRWSATLFGTYYWGSSPHMANGAPMSPAMLGFYNVSRFGGYMDYHNGNFGIQAGAQVVERTGMNPHYEVEPIATPYITVGRGKKKLGFGLPLGQILNGIIRR